MIHHHLEKLFTDADNYSKTKVGLLELYVIEKLADLISSIAAKLVIFMTVVLFIVTINIGIALWIGELLGKSYYGFFIVGGCYILLSFLLHTFKDQWLKIPISNYIIRKLVKK